MILTTMHLPQSTGHLGIPQWEFKGEVRHLYQVLLFFRHQGDFVGWGSVEWYTQPRTTRNRHRSTASKYLEQASKGTIRHLFGRQHGSAEVSVGRSSEVMDTAELRAIDQAGMESESSEREASVDALNATTPAIQSVCLTPLLLSAMESADEEGSCVEVMHQEGAMADGPSSVLHSLGESQPVESLTVTSDTDDEAVSGCSAGHVTEDDAVYTAWEEDADYEDASDQSDVEERELSEVAEDPGEPPAVDFDLEDENCQVDPKHDHIHGQLQEPSSNSSHGFFKRRLLLSEVLRHWALVTNATDQSMELLIGLLKKERPIDDTETMSSTWRALAKLTRRDKAVLSNRKIRRVPGDSANGQNIAEEYTHFGLANMLKRNRQWILDATIPDRRQQPKVVHFFVEFWTDGSSLFRSGRYNQLWPVSVTVVGIADGIGGKYYHVPPAAMRPLKIGFYLGTRKPAHSEIILRDLVDELKLLDPSPRSDRVQEMASKLHGSFTVTLKAGKGDRPARALCKEVKGHSSSEPCERCDAPAVKVHGVTGMSVYKTRNLNLREDNKFLEYAKHYKKFVVDKATGRTVPNSPSPLCELGYFGMVTGFPYDTMHLLYKNVLPTLLEYLMEGLHRVIPGSRLSKAAVLDSRIDLCAAFCPDEFNRKVSPTQFSDTWKATEVRHFFLYLAYPLFEDLLDEQALRLLRYMQYFLYLVSGTSRKPIPHEDCEFAQSIIQYFVPAFIRCRPRKTAKVTLHDLLHLLESCIFHGVHADAHAVWREENEFRHDNRLVRSGNAKLRQIETKFLEREKYQFVCDENGRILRTASGEPVCGRTPILNHLCPPPPFIYGVDRCGTKKVKFHDFVLSTKFRDSFCLINPGDGGATTNPFILRIRDVLEDPAATNDGDKICLVGNIYRKKSDLFKTPAPSRLKHVYVFSDPCTQWTTWKVSAVVGKLYVVPRFKAFHDTRPLAEVTSDDLGLEYEEVPEWVGLLERHIGHQGNSLY